MPSESRMESREYQTWLECGRFLSGLGDIHRTNKTKYQSSLE